MIQTTPNLNLFDKKKKKTKKQRGYYVNSLYIVSAILKEVLHEKQKLMLRVFSIELSFFIIPKITVV